MRFVLATLLILGACVVDHSSDPGPSIAIQPRTCVADVTLDGSAGNAQPTQLGPYAVDRNGITICLHLDATQNQIAAHFAAETDSQTGSVSSFATLLEDPSYAPLQDSWDVQVDSRTFSNLEWNAPLQAVTDAVLWVHARDQSSTTTIAVSLFEPLE